MNTSDPPDWVNIGYGDDISIRDLAEMVRDAVGYSGTLKFDASKPDGPPRKLVNSSRLRSLGWSPRIGLREGMERTYADFCAELESGRMRVN
jgi:GDP-L-fucose synthase